jgi:hypothetical protein
LDLGAPGDLVSFAVSNDVGSASARTAFLTASRTNFLDTIASGVRSFSVTNAPLVGGSLQLTVTKTNGTQITLAATNNGSSGTNTSQLTQLLVDQVNANAELLMPDGAAAEDSVGYDPYGQPYAEFNLRARTPGWNAAQVQAQLTGSPVFVITPAGTNKLDGNLNDLRPRNHLYISAGVTNLVFTFPLDTTAYSDGYHELAAVVCEGSHVRAQKRVVQNVRIQNTSLTAAFTCLVGDTNTALEATLQFAVVANTNNVTKIELFSTGGLLASATNQFNANFAIAGTNLDLGLHPFYAIVTGAGGQQYRTETKWIRLVGEDALFSLRPSLSPFTLAWSAAAGRRYDILSATNVNDVFRFRDTVALTNATGLWTETNVASPQHFYRVRVSP